MSNHSPDFGSTNSPPTKRPYRSSSLTMSRASGAGAYSHSVSAGTGGVPCARAQSRGQSNVK